MSVLRRRRSAMAETFAREVAHADAQAAADDDLMARAARGEPFWGVGKPANAEVVGLGPFVPVFPIDGPPEVDEPRQRFSNLRLAMLAKDGSFGGRLDLDAAAMVEDLARTLLAQRREHP